MAAPKALADFLNSERGAEARQSLMVLSDDPKYNTPATYTSQQSKYPDNRLPFVDKHMQYLGMHPQVDARNYIANLRLMTRSRG